MSVRVVLLLLLQALTCQSLYEDQVFKFDWRQSLLGTPTGAKFWESSAHDPAMIVRTAGVLASVCAETGHIRWRHVLPNPESVFDLAVTEKNLATVSGGETGSAKLRIWNPVNGALSHEVTVHVEGKEIDPVSFISGSEANLVVFDPESGSVKIHVFDLKKGGGSEEIRSASFSTGAKNDPMKCTSTKSAFACLSPGMRMIYYTALPIQTKASFAAIPLAQIGYPKELRATEIRAVPGTKDLLEVVGVKADNSEELFAIKMEKGQMSGTNHLSSLSGEKTISMLTGCKNTDDMLMISQKCSDKACTKFEKSVRISKLAYDKYKPTGHEITYTFDHDIKRISNAWATCENDDTQTSYQLVILTEDGSMTSVTPLGNTMWSREESLADIVKVELVATALQDDDGTYDNEGQIHHHGHDAGGIEAKNILQQFVKRIKHHLSLMHTFINTFLELRSLEKMFNFDSDSSYDDFGLRKVIVTVTSSGKLVGMDSKSGRILWQTLFSGSGSDGINLHQQRSALHFGLDARCALFYQNKFTKRSHLMSFNPLNGEVVEDKELDASFQQAILLHNSNDDHIRPLLLLYGSDDRIDVEPKFDMSEYLSEIVDKTYAVTLSKESNEVVGKKLKVKSDGKTMYLQPIWNLVDPNAKILDIKAKSSEEIVHSQGRVMADRSVLFKYVNPNLAFILSEGTDSTGKNFINVNLVDLVTGRIIFSINHKRVNGPYHVVHSENWAVYTYYNEKARRGELGSIELFEGSKQTNSTVFSSLADSVQHPLVERQAYILGPTITHVSAMTDTRTEKGITTKNILLATNSGSIYSIPRAFLDPRRPNMNTPPESREPGLPPYVPEIQLPQEAVLNYNQSISAPRGLVTAPTGLESTSVVFAYGLDLYCTRVTPSKGFDLLKEDFDYYVISSVVLALVAAAYLTKRLSQRKNLKQAWK